jgi:competence protein ComEC
MTGGLSLLAGVLLGLGAATPPDPYWTWACGITAAGVLLSPLRNQVVARRLALLLAGMTFVCISVIRWQELRLTPDSADTRVLLTGTILTVPARNRAELGFDAEVRILEGPGADQRPRRARLAWRDPTIEPRVGERWRLLVRLGRADETSNFTAPDRERAAFRERVHFTARVLPAAVNARLAPADASVDQLRARIARRIAVQVADPDAAGLITALAVGLTSGMSVDQWRVFNATGTTHLVAISGLHVTLFAMLAFALARMLWRWLPWAWRLQREHFAILLGLGAAGGYSLLSGFSVPTQRTWVMLAVFYGARCCARHVAATRTWASALIAVLLYDVFAPLAPGFWLSFVAVGVILVVETTALRPAPRLRRAFWLQLAVMLALAPFTFAVFGNVSLVGLGVNLLAIPTISFVFVPLVLAGAAAASVLPAVDGLLFGLAAKLYEFLWPCMVWAADLDFAQWRMSPPAWWYALALPAALLLLKRWPPGLRWSAAAAVLPLLWAPSRLPGQDELRVMVFDAGRGSAVLLATRTHLLLFDTGDAWNTRGARISQMVIPALDALGRARVDLLMLPALSPDRAMGTALLAAERGVDGIVVGGGWVGTSLPVVSCSDAAFQWDGVRFEILAAGRAREFCALRVSTSRHSVLLGGELDAAAERQLLARLPRRSLSSDVTVISRQAGAAGSSPEWIGSVHAGLAVASGGIAGSNTRTLTLSRWRASGARVLDTRRDGAVEIGFGTYGIVVGAPARAARYPFAWRRD